MSELPMIPVFKPRLLVEEPTNLLETLHSSWWGTGPKVEEFEKAFASYVGVSPERCVMMSSCTAALHIALCLFPECKRLLVPGMTFISSALVGLYARKRVVFVEVGDDLCIDQHDALGKIQSEDDVIMPVHFGGQAASLTALEGHSMIEDCAHALGTFDNNGHVGTWHGMGCFSFQATKTLPIGDGGMLVLRNKQDRPKALALSWCGISESTWARHIDDYEWQYNITHVGYKYRANDVMAALALDQWGGLRDLLVEKQAIATRYSMAFWDLHWLKLPKPRQGSQSSHQEYIVRTEYRDALHNWLKMKGISSTVHYYPIHLYPIFKEFGEGYIAIPKLPRTELLWKEILTIPSYAGMTDEEQERVIDGIRSFKP